MSKKETKSNLPWNDPVDDSKSRCSSSSYVKKQYEKYPEFKDYGSLGGDIFLESTLGYKIHSNEYNHIKIIFFGFISCPDICPTTLNIVNQTFKDLGKKYHEKLNLFFISVDPKRDTIPSLKEYLNYFNSTFIGMIGNKEELMDIVRKYGGYFAESDQKNTTVISHTSYLYLLDSNNKIRALYKSDVTKDKLTKGIEKLIKENV